MAAASYTACVRAAPRGGANFPSRLHGRGGPLRRPSSLVPFRFFCSSSSPPSSGSYLDMWKKAMERERMSEGEARISQGSSGGGGGESLEQMTDQFNRILEVPREERDRIQRLQVIDRAAAAIAAARALVKEIPPAPTPEKPIVTTTSASSGGSPALVDDRSNAVNAQQGQNVANTFDSETGTLSQSTPGPDFWSWSPPEDTSNSNNVSLKPESKMGSHSKPTISLMEKDNSMDLLTIPFQSTLSQSERSPPLPPLQSLVEIEKVDSPLSTPELLPSADEQRHDELSSRNAAEAAEALSTGTEASSNGVNPDGSKWWKETGIEERPDGVVCRWTLNRGVSADGAVEWEDKYWEAANQFDHKELGSEKSGRDAAGNVWHEYWKEAMWQDLESGITHIEKTADKWGKNGKGDEWHEAWWEHYDASDHSEKWAHKWCSIDPKTPLEAGHAHVWHERWGEEYDGQGGSIKYTDKWAERSVGDGWAKWGDKWDEHFDMHGQGVKQGETWWEGEHGERWNRTWGEHHNASGWVHKYGKSSSGEHWDTHVQQETWYERYPHYGFDRCIENSVQLQAVPKPPDTFDAQFP